jgi:TRAP-type C4-dicarboxylate transport system permease small subunit
MPAGVIVNLLKASTRVVETFSTIGAVAGGAGILMLMLLATAGAIGRKFGQPVPDVLEACETIMFASVFLGMAYVALQRGHINVTMFTQRLSLQAQKIMDASVRLLAAAVFTLLTWSSWRLAWKWFLIREVRLAEFPWPIWPFRFLFVFGIGLIALQLIFSAVNLFSKAPGSEGEPTPAGPQGEAGNAGEGDGP